MKRALLEALGVLPSQEGLCAKLAPMLAGELRCTTCGKVETCDADRAGACLAAGWPKCCGYTMTLVTAKQLAEEQAARATGGGS